MGASNIMMGLVVLLASLGTSCAALSSMAGAETPGVEISGVQASDEERIWLIRDRGNGIVEVFRCADLTVGEGIPRPVCIRSTFGDPPARR